MNITITKSGILWILLLILGFIFLCIGIPPQIKYSNAKDFTELDADKYQCGDYIVGDIHSFLKKKGESGQYLTSSETYMTHGSIYEIYTVPVKNNTYIRIMVSDSETKELLDSASTNPDITVHFEGIIIDSPLSTMNSWYEGIDDISPSDINWNLAIKQTQIKNKVHITYAGIGILAICLVILFTGRLKNEIFTEIKAPTTKYYNIPKSYNQKNELIIELMKMEKLQQQLKELKRHFLICLPFYPFGIYILIKAYYWEIKFLGLILLFLAIKITIKYFLNLQSNISLFFVHLFNRDSISVKINECQNTINSLSEKDISQHWRDHQN